MWIKLGLINIYINIQIILYTVQPVNFLNVILHFETQTRRCNGCSHMLSLNWMRFKRWFEIIQKHCSINIRAWISVKLLLKDGKIGRRVLQIEDKIDEAERLRLIVKDRDMLCIHLCFCSEAIIYQQVM